MSDEIKVARETIGIAADLMKAAGDNPDVQEAGKNLGQAALTISKAINTALLPIAAVNFAFDKARVYFSGEFQKDFLDRTKDIPLEEIVEPKASIAGPALQGLAFTHEEPNLKEMYLSLLATATDKRVSRNAHPGFVEIIRQLSGDEVEILTQILKSPSSEPIVCIRLQEPGKNGWQLLVRNLIETVDSQNAPISISNLAAMIDNWQRLGLVDVSYAEWLTNSKAYEWVERSPEYLFYKKKYETESKKLSVAQGRMLRTSFGTLFARAVGLGNALPEVSASEQQESTPQM